MSVFPASSLQPAWHFFTQLPRGRRPNPRACSQFFPRPQKGDKKKCGRGVWNKWWVMSHWRVWWVIESLVGVPLPQVVSTPRLVWSLDVSAATQLCGFRLQLRGHHLQEVWKPRIADLMPNVQFPLPLKLVQISGVQTSHGRLTLHISFGQQVPGLGLVTAKVRRSTLQGRSLQNLAEKTPLNLAPELSDPEKTIQTLRKLPHPIRILKGHAEPLKKWPSDLRNLRKGPEPPANRLKASKHFQNLLAPAQDLHGRTAVFWKRGCNSAIPENTSFDEHLTIWIYKKCQFNCVSVFLARSFAVLECADARQLLNWIITRELITIKLKQCY